MSTYKSFCENLTQSLFAIIDQHGSLLSWKKNWHKDSCRLLPESKNGLYHGINTFTLLTEQASQGYGTNKWLTFNQINKSNGRVKKGATGKSVCFWSILKKQSEKNPDEETIIPVFKKYKVFNLEQTTLEAGDVKPVTRGQTDIEIMIERLHIGIEHYGAQPRYNLSEDIIVLPHINDFDSTDAYYTTLLHEITHWTGGNENRLPRENMRSYAHDLKARAQEELTAEIGSFFLCAYFDLSGDIVNHASYVQSWKEMLTPLEIGRAIKDASKAFFWLIEAKNDAVTAGDGK